MKKTWYVNYAFNGYFTRKIKLDTQYSAKKNKPNFTVVNIGIRPDISFVSPKYRTSKISRELPNSIQVYCLYH